VADPAERVWGLGGEPFDEAAVLRLLAIKRREVDKGVILVAASLAQFDGLLDWDALPAARADLVRLLGGLLYFAGMLIMAWNVFKTIAAGRAADAPIPAPVLAHA